ncbi:MAG: uroporphyrinogen-III synthase [Clostridiales Family XIII bacterium]|nr:uroporphyrinogen-III synthase [Clostridiales Family XIII bacterium]
MNDSKANNTKQKAYKILMNKCVLLLREDKDNIIDKGKYFADFETYRFVPLISFENLAFDAAYVSHDLINCDWIFFTSKHGVDSFFSQLLGEKAFEGMILDRCMISKNHMAFVNARTCKIACIGSATARALQRYDMDATFAGSGRGSVAFAEEWLAKYNDGYSNRAGNHQVIGQSFRQCKIYIIAGSVYDANLMHDTTVESIGNHNPQNDISSVASRSVSQCTEDFVLALPQSALSPSLLPSQCTTTSSPPAPSATTSSPLEIVLQKAGITTKTLTTYQNIPPTGYDVRLRMILSQNIITDCLIPSPSVWHRFYKVFRDFPNHRPICYHVFGDTTKAEILGDVVDSHIVCL